MENTCKRKIELFSLSWIIVKMICISLLDEWLRYKTGEHDMNINWYLSTVVLYSSKKSTFYSVTHRL